MLTSSSSRRKRQQHLDDEAAGFQSGSSFRSQASFAASPHGGVGLRSSPSSSQPLQHRPDMYLRRQLFTAINAPSGGQQPRFGGSISPNLPQQYQSPVNRKTLSPSSASTNKNAASTPTPGTCVVATRPLFVRSGQRSAQQKRTNENDAEPPLLGYRAPVVRQLVRPSHLKATSSLTPRAASGTVAVSPTRNGGAPIGSSAATAPILVEPTFTQWIFPRWAVRSATPERLARGSLNTEVPFVDGGRRCVFCLAGEALPLSRPVDSIELRSQQLRSAEAEKERSKRGVRPTTTRGSGAAGKVIVVGNDNASATAASGMGAQGVDVVSLMRLANCGHYTCRTCALANTRVVWRSGAHEELEAIITALGAAYAGANDVSPAGLGGGAARYQSTSSGLLRRTDSSGILATAPSPLQHRNSSALSQRFRLTPTTVTSNASTLRSGSPQLALLDTPSRSMGSLVASPAASRQQSYANLQATKVSLLDGSRKAALTPRTKVCMMPSAHSAHHPGGFDATRPYYHDALVNANNHFGPQHHVTSSFLHANTNKELAEMTTPGRGGGGCSCMENEVTRDLSDHAASSELYKPLLKMLSKNILRDADHAEMLPLLEAFASLVGPCNYSDIDDGGKLLSKDEAAMLLMRLIKRTEVRCGQCSCCDEFLCHLASMDDRPSSPGNGLLESDIAAHLPAPEPSILASCHIVSAVQSQPVGQDRACGSVTGPHGDPHIELVPHNRSLGSAAAVKSTILRKQTWGRYGYKIDGCREAGEQRLSLPPLCSHSVLDKSEGGAAFVALLVVKQNNKVRSVEPTEVSVTTHDHGFSGAAVTCQKSASSAISDLETVNCEGTPMTTPVVAAGTKSPRSPSSAITEGSRDRRSATMPPTTTAESPDVIAAIPSPARLETPPRSPMAQPLSSPPLRPSCVVPPLLAFEQAGCKGLGGGGDSLPVTARASPFASSRPRLLTPMRMPLTARKMVPFNESPFRLDSARRIDDTRSSPGASEVSTMEEAANDEAATATLPHQLLAAFTTFRTPLAWQHPFSALGAAKEDLQTPSPDRKTSEATQSPLREPSPIPQQNPSPSPPSSPHPRGLDINLLLTRENLNVYSNGPIDTPPQRSSSSPRQYAASPRRAIDIGSPVDNHNASRFSDSGFFCGGMASPSVIGTEGDAANDEDLTDDMPSSPRGKGKTQTRTNILEEYEEAPADAAAASSGGPLQIGHTDDNDSPQEAEGTVHAHNATDMTVDVGELLLTVNDVSIERSNDVSMTAGDSSGDMDGQRVRYVTSTLGEFHKIASALKRRPSDASPYAVHKTVSFLAPREVSEGSSTDEDDDEHENAQRATNNASSRQQEIVVVEDHEQYSLPDEILLAPYEPRRFWEAVDEEESSERLQHYRDMLQQTVEEAMDRAIRRAHISSAVQDARMRRSASLNSTSMRSSLLDDIDDEEDGDGRHSAASAVALSPVRSPVELQPLTGAVLRRAIRQLRSEKVAAEARKAEEARAKGRRRPESPRSLRLHVFDQHNRSVARGGLMPATSSAVPVGMTAHYCIVELDYLDEDEEEDPLVQGLGSVDTDDDKQ